MGKILFSAIGTTDPVRNYHDGSWIHCCRHIKPDLTVIFLSKEMIVHEEHDAIYTKALEYLNQTFRSQALSETQLEIIRRPDLDTPHLCGALYSDFAHILTDLHQKYPGDEIYLNCSSGTPAIKQALTDMRFFLSFGNEIHFIQVDAPNQGKDFNGKRTDSDYESEINWELNEDNNPDAPVRMHPYDNWQHYIMMNIEYAKKLIAEHEYHAALTLLTDVLPELNQSDVIRSALKGADNRQMLLLIQAAEELSALDLPKPVKVLSGSVLNNCAEMLLTMQNDVQRHDYAGMLRKLTPFLYGLSKEAVRKLLNVNIDSYTKLTGQYDREKFEKNQPDLYQIICREFINGFPVYPATSNLLVLLNGKLPDCEVVQNITKLRVIEENARNKAAHDIQGIDDIWIQKKAKADAASILALCKNILCELDPNIHSVYWDSYKIMDQTICDMLIIK